jgi:hypothetical protein
VSLANYRRAASDGRPQRGNVIPGGEALLTSQYASRLHSTLRFFLGENFLGKWDANTRQLGRNSRQVAVPDKGIGVGTTTFVAAIRNGPCMIGARAAENLAGSMVDF